MKKKDRGFSLIEILVSMLILTFITIGIYGVLNLGEKTFFSDMGLIDLQQQVRQSMDGMIRELRQSDSSDITIRLDRDKITFRFPSSISPIAYYPDIEYEKVGAQIIRSHAGNVTILANDINSLDFCCCHDGSICDPALCDEDCSNADVLQVQLSANKTVNRRAVFFPSNGAVTEKVRLRN